MQQLLSNVSTVPRQGSRKAGQKHTYAHIPTHAHHTHTHTPCATMTWPQVQTCSQVGNPQCSLEQGSPNARQTFTRGDVSPGKIRVRQTKSTHILHTHTNTHTHTHTRCATMTWPQTNTNKLTVGKHQCRLGQGSRDARQTFTRDDVHKGCGPSNTSTPFEKRRPAPGNGQLKHSKNSRQQSTNRCEVAVCGGSAPENPSRPPLLRR